MLARPYEMCCERCFLIQQLQADIDTRQAAEENPSYVHCVCTNVPPVIIDLL